MRRVSMATRNELVAAVAERYARSSRLERGRILDEFVAVTGHHRKQAMRLLRGSGAGPAARRGRRDRVYDVAIREALIVLWEASDRVCGKRLRPLLPVLVEAMERHGHLQLAAEVRAGVLAMSAATIDRLLREVRTDAPPPSGRHATRPAHLNDGLGQNRPAGDCPALAGPRAEVKDHDVHLKLLTQQVAPDLVQAHGMGAGTAAEMLLLVGDNRERIHSEAALAKLCDVCPVPASSGKTSRHRLNRGGHRQANAALYRVVIVRMRAHQPTLDYVRRRTAEGKTKLEIIRCLKRFVAREIFGYLCRPANAQRSAPAMP